MIKKTIAAVTIIALLTVVVVQAMEKDKPKDGQYGLDVGLKAPDFELKTLEGKTVKLSDYKGQKVMLNFWATWCSPCKEEMPDMQSFYTESEKQIAILAVNIDPQYDVEGFVKEMNITFPILLDEEDKVSKIYQVLSLPTSYFIDEEGIIQNKFVGALSIEKMREITENL